MKYFYHLTDKDALPGILKNGLIPQIGPRSESAKETENFVFLCRHKDIPYWKILINKPVLLRVYLDQEKTEEYGYDCYSEYLVKDKIPPENIKRVYPKIDTVKAMKDLCVSYIYTFSHLVTDFARYYRGDDYVNKERLETQLTVLKIGTQNLDYSSLTKKEIRKELKDAGENGGYTFVDRYMNTDRRLYEQLLYYPEDDFFESRKWLNRTIKNIFKGCLKVNTGGWGY